MRFLINKVPVLVLASIVSFNSQAGSLNQQDIVVASASEVSSCDFVGTISSSSGQLKQTGWKKHASHKAILKAEKIGATHLVIEGYEARGVFHGGLKARAFSCHHEQQQHAGQTL